MNFLALECSSPRKSVAVSCEGRLLAEASHTSERATPIFALVAEALSRAGVARESIEGVAVGLGPGSYTGIRAAIASAQGWELGSGVKLLGIDSVTACALRCQKLGLRGRVAVIVDAQRDEFYLAEFELSDSSTPLLLSALRIVNRQAIEVLYSQGVQFAGPNAGVQGIPGQNIFPDAAALADLAVERRDFVAAERLEPIYLRPVVFVKAPSFRPSQQFDAP